MSDQNIAGVYSITNTKNGRVYIGSSLSIGHRFQTHRRELRSGKHVNAHLQAAWNMYGEKAFTFKIVERCNPELCRKREQYYLDRVPKAQRYNISVDAHGKPKQHQELSIGLKAFTRLYEKFKRTGRIH